MITITVYQVYNLTVDFMVRNFIVIPTCSIFTPLKLIIKYCKRTPI